MALEYPELENVKTEVNSEINGYIDAITLLGSLRQYLRERKINCYIEKKINKKNGGYKTPDLFIVSENYLIVDHKYTESRSHENLISKIEEMEEYNTIFVLSNPKVEATTEIEPEIVMLTPKKAVKHFQKILKCPTTWGYKLDEEISIEQSISFVKDSKISALFDPDLLFPIAADVAKYKFIISNAPLPYTSWQVYVILWNLIPAHATRFFTPQFDVKYDVLLDVFNNLFPPWISEEVKQLNDGRLKKALAFLHELKLIKWLKREKEIIVDRSKGRYIADLLSYLIDNYIKKEHAKAVKKYERELKKLKKAEPIVQKEIREFF